MPYRNQTHFRRLVIIPIARDLFGQIHVTTEPKYSRKKLLTCAEPKIEFSLLPESSLESVDNNVYNMPFLFDEDGKPWHEANGYLMNLVEYKHVVNRPTDDVRKKASKLLDYKLFCEENGLDWRDFSGKRRSHRPTYKYFRHLVDSPNRGAMVVNQYTSVIYDFYQYVSCNWCDIDMDRVDAVSNLKLIRQSSHGSFAVDIRKRSQTQRVSSCSTIPFGFVRDGGENLRPLTNSELKELLDIITSDKFNVLERLIIQTALFTGARKQSVLTLRKKHLEYFKEKYLCNDGTYAVNIGPGTGIDTKFDKPQKIYFPKQIAEDIKIYSHSKNSKRRQEKFNYRFLKEHPELTAMKESDMYVFLSDQGNCYYMGLDDPRYAIVRSKPIGQISHTLKRKLLKHTSENFSNDFSYHWLRATYAYQFYLWLLPLRESGHLQLGEEISLVQRRLNHEKRETTENYLKLFNQADDKMAAQELFERKLFDKTLLDEN